MRCLQGPRQNPKTNKWSCGCQLQDATDVDFILRPMVTFKDCDSFEQHLLPLPFEPQGGHLFVGLCRGKVWHAPYG